MKKLYSIAIALGCTVLSDTIFAQTNIITTVVGTGAMAYTGDGGPATAATLNQPARIATDGAGNKYISDASNHCIRKVSPAGIITTVAGSGTSGFSGDGGQATAAQLKAPIGVALDAAGNIYIADQNNYRIRKVSTSGIISTVAGNGTNSFSGDGGQATAASIKQVGGVAVDASGNIYIADFSHRVRKVNSSGIISTIAGLGSPGFGGDGGMATAASLNLPWDVIVDAANNVYVCEMYNNRVRKIDPFGVITTIAGNGTTTYTGDGGPATAAGIYAPQGMVFDGFGNLYIGDRMNNVIRRIEPSGIISTVAGTGTAGFSGDGGPAQLAMLGDPTGVALDYLGDLYIVTNNRVRKLNVAPAYAADSFYVNLNKDCSGLSFSLGTHHYAAGMTVRSYFGDGVITTSTVAPSVTGATGYVAFSHAYQYNGTYTIKHVLMNGTTALDSLTYTYAYKLCNSISVNFYLDANNDCQFSQTTDPRIYLPVSVEIDSNGHPVDTLVTPCGFFYKAYGSPGDIYTIKVIGNPPGLVLTCPSTGIMYDTLQPALDTTVIANAIGFNCSTVSGFDLTIHAASIAMRHTFLADIIVDNLYCTPQPATLTANFSPKYAFYSANATPSSASGSLFTWNFTGLSVGASAPTYIHYHGEKPTLPYYMQGDTAHSSFAISPIIGDMDTSNNNDERLDSINSSYDPNYISVAPDGCIPSAATELEYAIGFENTGNDTAFNIFIMDTLSAALDPSTLKVVATSANMNLVKIKNGTQTILKFDFPNINLLDSSHHNFCNGMVMYRIKTKASMPDGTFVSNRAGIYFDTNPVVMTNTADNTINCPVTAVATIPNTGKISIFPNPANNVLTIKTDNATYNTFDITSAIGQSLIKGQLNSTNTKVDISTLPAGLYYISLRGEHGSEVKKFVKM